MGSKENIQEYLERLQKKLIAQLPKIRKEIKVYEDKLKKGELNQNPKPSPQF